MKLLLDTNVLVRLCHPTGHQDVKDWFRALLLKGGAAPEFLISVLADYELRRALLRRGGTASLDRLDELARSVTVVPITPEVVRRGAEIFASIPESGGNRASDADVLMAAQAQLEGAVLVTSDALLRDVPGIMAKDWHEIATS